MLIIGAASRGAGKTRFACSLISKLSSQCEIVGIKVTTINDVSSGCPHGKSDCGLCASLEGEYYIAEETDSKANKDTCKMLAAGASRVFWVRALKANLKEAIAALLNIIGNDVVSVCESNGLRLVVEPGLFIMVEGGSENRKASAEDVAQYADRTIFFDGNKFNVEFDDIKLIDKRWAIKVRATAIVMAGGVSARMGQDKSMLPIDNKPMIEHIIDQFRPNFEEIIVSANDVEKYAFLGVKIVPDEIPGKGPLMGIVSALKVSANELNFVVACDVPEIDMVLVRQMLRQSSGFDAVIPKTGLSLYEPLFAVYNKSSLAAMDASLLSGDNRIVDALSQCRVKYVELTDEQQPRNINTMGEYLEFVRRQADAVV